MISFYLIIMLDFFFGSYIFLNRSESFYVSLFVSFYRLVSYKSRRIEMVIAWRESEHFHVPNFILTFVKVNFLCPTLWIFPGGEGGIFSHIPVFSYPLIKKILFWIETLSRYLSRLRQYQTGIFLFYYSSWIIVRNRALFTQSCVAWPK